MKKTIKSILAVVLCFVMLIGTIAIGGNGFADVLEAISVKASAAETVSSGTCGDNLTWVLDDEGTLTISGTGNMTDYDNCGFEAPWYSSEYTITNVVIENGVTSIGECAFFECDITDINIPDSVTNIGYGAFFDTACYDTSNWENDVLYIDNCLIEARTTVSGDYTIKPGTRLIAGCAFRYCTSLTGITIPDSVTSIGSSAFEDCTSLTGLTIPDSVTSIGNRAFCGCTGLTDITIPDSVTSIGYGAFEDCTSLTSIIIPDSVTSINGAFYGCTGLTDITIPDSVTSIGSSAFEDCTGLTDITIPDSVISIGESAFEDCTSLTGITIPDSVTSIGEYAFYGCTSLKDITIPDSVTSIGYRAFFDTACYRDYSNWENEILYLDNCLIDTTLSISGDHTIKSGTRLIADGSLRRSTGLTDITIPDSVTSIGDGAFSICESLTSIVIPDSVTSIGEYAFYYCTSLTDVYYSGSESDRADITIGIENDSLTDAVWHYNYDLGHVHEYTSSVTAQPTCTEEGEITYTCSCGKSYTEATPATGHNPAKKAENFTGTTYDIVTYCSACNEEFNRETKNDVEGIMKNLNQVDSILSSSVPRSQYGSYIDFVGENIISENSIENLKKLKQYVENSGIVGDAYEYMITTIDSDINTITEKLHEICINISVPSSKTIGWKYKAKMTATASLPEGYHLAWYEGDNLVSNDATFTTGSLTSAHTYTAKVVDGNGNVVSSDSQNKSVTVSVKTGFFDKIISFFQRLFGSDVTTL